MVVPPLVVVVHMAITPGYERLTLLSDDAGYYLGVARNIADGNGSTFTGLASTNGYHPLWTLLIVPLAAAIHRPDHLALAVLALQGVLWGLSVREAMRIGRAVGCWQCAAGALAVYAVLAALTGRLAFTGMESGLAMLLLLVIARLVVEARDGTADVAIGAALALLCLARLDAVLVVVPIVLLALGDGGERRSGRVVRRTAVLAGPTVVVLGLYMVVNKMAFDAATPVSGRAKALGAPFLNVDPVRQFLEAGVVVGRPLWFGAISLVLVCGALATTARRSHDPLRRLTSYAVALVAGQAVLLTYLVVGTSWRVWPWYHYLVTVYAFSAAVVVLRWAEQRFGAAVRRLAVAGALGVVVVQAALTFRPEDRAHAESLSGAAFVREDLPPDAVVAMGDRAGIFGLLAERPLLHLEGLVADTAYLRELGRGRALDRMIGEGVDYYVRYGDAGDPVDVDGRACRRFHEPSQSQGAKFPLVVCDGDRVFAAGEPGDQFQVWAFRPDLNDRGRAARWPIRETG